MKELYVYYGSYPQTHVGDESLIVELNKLNEINDKGYYEYNGKEYAKVIATPYLYGSNYTYSDGKRVYGDVTEWFLIEPIKWRIILENTDGSYQLYSEYILDATSYCDYNYSRSIDGEDVYENNYKYSNVRAWLNGYNGTDYKMPDYTNTGLLNQLSKMIMVKLQK